MHKAVVTALGHISERWRKELEQPSPVSGIATGNVEDAWSHECQIVECRNAEMNEKSHGINPTVQRNMRMIEGLILILTM
jgi:hypothetical protein